jgi:phage protein D
MPQLQKRSQAPDFEVKVNGQSFTQASTDGLTNIIVEDHVDMVGVAQLTFNNRGINWRELKIGGEVEVQFGGGSGRKNFKGNITGLRHYWKSGVETVTLTAMDPTCKLAASRTTKVYEDKKDSDVVNEVVGRAGLEVGKVDATDKVHPYIFQRNESDLNFLKRLASRNGYLLMANEGKIDFLKPAFGGNTVEIESTRLTALDYEFTDQQIPTELTVIGWSYLDKKKVEATASPGSVQTMGGGKNSVSGTGQIWQGSSYISDVMVATQEDAKAMAEGELNRLARNYMRGRATVNGTGEVFAGQNVKFIGQRGGFNPEGYVISVRHVVEATGLHSSQIIFCGNTHTT